MKGPQRHTHSFGEGVQLVEVGVAHHMRPQPIAMLPAWFVDQHRHRASFADHPLCTLYAPSTLGCMTAPEVELHRVWRQVFGRAAEPAFQSLTTRLREPTRRYHTATHVLWVVRHVDALAAAQQNAEDIWIEKLRLDTRDLVQAGGEDLAGVDLDALLAGGDAGALVRRLGEDMEMLRSKSSGAALALDLEDAPALMAEARALLLERAAHGEDR